MQFTYTARLRDDLKRWRDKNIISADAYELINRDIEERSWGLSFSAIVSLLGIISLCFAAITFVAANWEEMPRLLRVAILFVSMWACYAGSVVLHARRQEWFSQLLVLLGCALFGASIMLISQMYHIQGNPRDAVLMWSGGSLAAALLLRSTPALILAIALFLVWHGYYIDLWKDNFVNWLFLPLWIAGAFGAWLLRSRYSAHLLAIGLLFWIWSSALVLADKYDQATFLTAPFLLSFLGISAILVWREKVRALINDFDAAVLFYLAVPIVAGLSAWAFAFAQQETVKGDIAKFYQAASWPLWIIAAAGIALAGYAYSTKSRQFYDAAFISLWMVIAAILSTINLTAIPFIHEAYALAVSVWMIRMGGRQDISLVTRLGYAFFALVMMIIYFRTAGSLLGTAGFYLTAGIIMVAGAIFLPKIMKRFDAGSVAGRESGQ